MKRLRIAQVSPLYESVPPRLYGGTERVVSFLTEELVAQGHEVTLFASGDSATAAKLVAACDKALRMNRECVDELANHIAMLQMVQNQINDFDVIHYHIDYIHYPLTKQHPFPHITTLHGRLNICDLQHLYTFFDDMPVSPFRRHSESRCHTSTGSARYYDHQLATEQQAHRIPGAQRQRRHSGNTAYSECGRNHRSTFE